MSEGQAFVNKISEEAKKKKMLMPSMTDMAKETLEAMDMRSLYESQNRKAYGTETGLTSIRRLNTELQADAVLKTAAQRSRFQPMDSHQLRTEIEFREKQASYQQKERDQEKAAMARNKGFADMTTIDLNLRISEIKLQISELEARINRINDPSKSIHETAERDYLQEYQAVAEDLLKTQRSKGKLFGNYKKHIALAREKYDFYTVNRQRLIGQKQEKLITEQPGFSVKTDDAPSFDLTEQLKSDETALGRIEKMNPEEKKQLEKAIHEYRMFEGKAFALRRKIEALSASGANDADLEVHLDSLRQELSVLYFHSNASLLSVRLLLNPDAWGAITEAGELMTQAGYISKHYGLDLPGLLPEQSLGAQKYGAGLGLDSVTSNIRLPAAHLDVLRKDEKGALKAGYRLQHDFEMYALSADTQDLHFSFAARKDQLKDPVPVADCLDLTVFTRPLPKVEKTDTEGKTVKKLVFSRGASEGKHPNEVVDDYVKILTDWKAVTFSRKSDEVRESMKSLLPRMMEAVLDLNEFMMDEATRDTFTAKSHDRIFDDTAGMPTLERKVRVTRNILEAIRSRRDMVKELAALPEYEGLEKDLNAMSRQLAEVQTFLNGRIQCMEKGYSCTPKEWASCTDSVQGLVKEQEIRPEQFTQPLTKIEEPEPAGDALKALQLERLRSGVTGRNFLWVKFLKALQVQDGEMDDKIAEMLRIHKRGQIHAYGPSAKWISAASRKNLDKHDGEAAMDDWMLRKYNEKLSKNWHISVMVLSSIGYYLDANDFRAIPRRVTGKVEERLKGLYLGERENEEIGQVKNRLKALGKDHPDDADPVGKLEDYMMLSEQVRFEHVKSLLTEAGMEDPSFDEIREGERLLRIGRIPMYDESIPEDQRSLLLGTVLKEEIDKLREKRLRSILGKVKYFDSDNDLGYAAFQAEMKRTLGRTILSFDELSMVSQLIQKKKDSGEWKMLPVDQALSAEAIRLLMDSIREVTGEKALVDALKEANGGAEPSPEVLEAARKLQRSRLGKVPPQKDQGKKILDVLARIEELKDGGENSVFSKLMEGGNPFVRLEKWDSDEDEDADQEAGAAPVQAAPVQRQEVSSLLDLDGEELLDDIERQFDWEETVKSLSDKEQDYLRLLYHEDKLNTREEQRAALEKALLTAAEYPLLAADIKDYEEELEWIDEMEDILEHIQSLNPSSDQSAIDSLNQELTELIVQLKDQEEDLYLSQGGPEDLSLIEAKSFPKVLEGMAENITKKRDELQEKADAINEHVGQCVDELMKHAKDPSATRVSEAAGTAKKTRTVKFSGVDEETVERGDMIEVSYTSTADKEELSRNRKSSKK